MYSRRFPEPTDVPADYGGVALRMPTQKKKEEDEEKDSFFQPASAEKKQEGVETRRIDNRSRRMEAPFSYDRSLCRPRRPLYEEEGRHRSGKREDKREREKMPNGGNASGKGLLSSLFSLSGKSFTMEDIILAGLILLLLGEQENGRKIDGELLFALTFLLIGGR